MATQNAHVHVRVRVSIERDDAQRAALTCTVATFLVVAAVVIRMGVPWWSVAATGLVAIVIELGRHFGPMLRTRR